MKGYEKYKEVGLPWLKEIPEGWETKELGSIFAERREKVNDSDYQPLSVTKNGIFLQLENVAKTNNGDNRKKVLKNDFVINSRSDRKGSSGLSNYDGSVSLINTVLRIRKGNKKFWNYLLKSIPFQEEFYRNGKGIVADLWSTNYQAMKKINIPVPSLPEQHQIANFLDWKISEIDRLIELEKEKIQRIKEYYDRLNESYFEDIEKNYDEIIKIRNFAKLQNGISESGSFFLKGNPFINYSDVFNNDILPNQFDNVADSNKKQQELFSVRKGDLFITRTSETVEDAASVCLCKETVNKAVFSGFLIRLRAFNPIFSDEFLLYYLKSMVVRNQIISNLNIVTRVSVSQNLIKNINLKIVPSEVQENVVKNINKNNINKNKIIELYIKNISYLEELKQTLISDAVTGKIDVRNIKITQNFHGKEED